LLTQKNCWECIRKMAKICIISPSLKLGGIERALTTLTKEFQLIGHEIHFVTCLKDVHFYDLTEKIKVYEPAFKRTTSQLNKLLFYPRLLKYIRSTVLSIQPDRVLVFGDLFSPIALLALKGTKYPIYVSDRTIPNYKFSFPILFLKKLLYPKSAGFIAQTKRSRDFKIRQYGDKLRIEIIPNALPELEKGCLNNSTRETKLIYVGRFAWEKDPEILIHAMKNISIRFPNWTLQMAGTGPLLEPMKALVHELSLERNVEFLGKVSDVAALYQSASILVLPSIVEGFPNTLIEAMFFGLPTICFSDIPFEDIITNDLDGLVVHERSPEALTDAIALLIEREDLRSELGTNASISISRFDKQNISKQVLSFMKL
jgi:GalNAc-alpha-(1->4)-GalNAc-alpha-(1->3)-diNAcBac-PP-undecaprenol alpha-1,4-N-acetyl-D-galactosaminyltransferase